MEIFTELNDKHKNLSIALGFFDGVHLGHKAVIEKAVDYALKNNLKSAVITFSSHPAQKFNKNFEGYIIPPKKRYEYFEQFGVDYCWALDFDNIADIEAEKYIKDVLFKNFSPKAVTSGFNHHFGQHKSGNTTVLKNFSSIYNYEYFEIPPVLIDDITVSSSVIREFIRQGDIDKLNKFLGHDFEISGKVQHGKKVGSKLGFKTANIEYPRICVWLPYGVYGVNVTISGQTYKGIANFGVKPTFSENLSPILEVHILDFNEDIYGKNLTVEFKKFIRSEKKFNSPEELSEQIKADIDSFLK